MSEPLIKVEFISPYGGKPRDVDFLRKYPGKCLLWLKFPLREPNGSINTGLDGAEPFRLISNRHYEDGLVSWPDGHWCITPNILLAQQAERALRRGNRIPRILFMNLQQSTPRRYGAALTGGDAQGDIYPPMQIWLSVFDPASKRVESRGFYARMSAMANMLYHRPPPPEAEEVEPPAHEPAEKTRLRMGEQEVEVGEHWLVTTSAERAAKGAERLRERSRPARRYYCRRPASRVWLVALGEDGEPVITDYETSLIGVQILNKPASLWYKKNPG